MHHITDTEKETNVGKEETLEVGGGRKEDFVSRLVKEESASKLFKIDSKCVKEDSIAIIEKEEYFSKLVKEEAVYKFVKKDSVFMKEESICNLVQKRGSKMTTEGSELVKETPPDVKGSSSRLEKEMTRKRSSLKELVIGKRDSLSVTWDSHVARADCVPVTV